MEQLGNMARSKKKSASLVLAGFALLTGGYITFKRYLEFRRLQSELGSIPWDIPKEYESWKTFFNSNPKIKD